MADNGKINLEKGMFSAAAWTVPFLNLTRLKLKEEKSNEIHIFAWIGTSSFGLGNYN